MSGHSTIQYNSWLISCFGVLSPDSDQCTIFDTVQQKIVSSSIVPDQHWGTPRARIRTTMSLVNNQILIFGGLDGQDYLSDVWLLDLKNGPQLEWQHMQSNRVQPRSGHVAVQLNSSTILYHGGQTSQYSLATHNLILSLPTFTWSTHSHTKRSPIAADADDEIVHAYATDRQSISPKSGMGVGMIVGIVVGILAFVGIAIGILVWHRHR
ncbi:hypothetical protein CLU79DRAFT_705740, partial [Phycomyces nitens]